MHDAVGGLEATSGTAVEIVSLATEEQAAEQPSQEGCEMQSWTEAIDSGGPLDLDDLCWFYLDPFVCPTALCLCPKFAL